jgi:hypothetical protein
MHRYGRAEAAGNLVRRRIIDYNGCNGGWVRVYDCSVLLRVYRHGLDFGNRPAAGAAAGTAADQAVRVRGRYASVIRRTAPARVRTRMLRVSCDLPACGP